jgi:hypothetical protein
MLRRGAGVERGAAVCKTAPVLHHSVIIIGRRVG